MSTYKTNHPLVIAADVAYDATRTALYDRATEFAAMFGGVPMFVNRRGVTSFECLSFERVMLIHLWLKRQPDSQIQRLRASPQKDSSATQKQELKGILAKWREAYDRLNLKEVVSLDPFLQTIGLSLNRSLSGDFRSFRVGDYIFIKTEATLNKNVTEILGSEFTAAEKAHNAKD